MPVTTRTNEDIKKDIIDQLYWDARVDASTVQVEVDEGSVTLNGNVPNYMAYEAAEDNAWAMAGVREVRNELAIEHPAGVELPGDSEVKANVDNTLLWSPDIESSEIDTTVEKGLVTVRGTVDAYWKKVRVENLVLGLAGVTGITNELTVVPTEKYEDKAIADDIASALERNSLVDLDLIDVEVQNGRITLTGAVPTLPAYRTVQTTAENTLGVIAVDNELAIR